ncbi:hypothetical protein NF212_23050 [Parasalinivibrio latis]|uniref:hypothetical protein n=1 Tax=Parasalinivibrio latis TaxID=2952610 RepID=UPI0030E10654
MINILFFTLFSGIQAADIQSMVCEPENLTYYYEQIESKTESNEIEAYYMYSEFVKCLYNSQDVNQLEKILTSKTADDEFSLTMQIQIIKRIRNIDNNIVRVNGINFEDFILTNSSNSKIVTSASILALSTFKTERSMEFLKNVITSESYGESNKEIEIISLYRIDYKLANEFLSNDAKTHISGRLCYISKKYDSMIVCRE